jgi:hypothetical protein
MNSGSSLLWNLLADIPVFIALLACMVFVVMRWKGSPKAALLALIGLVLLLLHTPIFEAVYAFVPEMIVRSGSGSSWSNTFFLLGLINFSAMALAFGFLLAAVFVGREPVRPTTS